VPGPPRHSCSTEYWWSRTEEDDEDDDEGRSGRSFAPQPFSVAPLAGGQEALMRALAETWTR
jgi:hypothetical protein